MLPAYWNRIEETCRQKPQRVLFAEATDKRVLQAARILADEGLALPELLGGPYELRDLGINTRGLKVIHPKQPRHVQPYIEQYLRENRHKGATRQDAERLFGNPWHVAAASLRHGHCDIVMGGNKSVPQKVFRYGLKQLEVDPAAGLASAFYLMISRDGQKSFAFADCSLNVDPDPPALGRIAISTAGAFRLLTDEDPRVALLSFSSKGSALHPRVDKVQQAARWLQNNHPRLLADGELQFDTALLESVAQKKAPDARLKGNANVFIFPTLESANIAQKMTEHLAGYTSIGPLTVGLRHSWQLLPVQSTPESIVRQVLAVSYLKINSENVQA